MILSRRELIKFTAAALAGAALPNSIANALPHPAFAPSLGCDNEFPFFGAHYPDATCIEGFLWDLDSCDEPKGALLSGGDWPCPYCNASGFLEHIKEEIDEAGYIAFSDGESFLDNPYLKGSRFPHLTAPLQDFWREGFKQASIDPEAIAERKALQEGTV
jgi:hypothetical protein